MFYNLKIHSNNSEFSLESEDKAIIAREMDLYFSHFFCASNEFNSKIKKVELTNNNLKSINAIETISTAETKPEIKIDTPQKNIEQNNFAINDDQILEIEKNISNVVNDNEIESNLKKEFCEQKDSEKNNIPIEISDFEDLDIDNKGLNLEFSDNESYVEKPQQSPKNDISVEKLLKKAENELNSLDIENTKLKDDISAILDGQTPVKIETNKENTTNEISFKNDFEFENNDLETAIISFNPDTIEEMNIKNEINNEKLDEKEVINFTNENQAKVDDIFATPLKNSPQEETEPIEVPQMSDEDVSTISTTPEPTFAQNVQKAIEEFENQAPTPSMLEKEYNIPSVTEEKIEHHNINLEENTKPKIEQTANELPHEFSDFLQIFDTEKTIDDFLICSYYVKNIANIDSFTMKTINAKLFRATGKIAGMSILNELIENGFIEIVDDSDIKKYSITQKGEEYFAQKFQG